MKGEDRAVNVELRVRAGVAAVRHREIEQLVPVRLDRLRHLFEKIPALREAQGTQSRSPLAARMLQRGSNIEAVAADLSERLLGRGIDERLRGARSFDPAVAEITAQRLHLRLRCFFDRR